MRVVVQISDYQLYPTVAETGKLKEKERATAAENVKKKHGQRKKTKQMSQTAMATCASTVMKRHDTVGRWSTWRRLLHKLNFLFVCFLYRYYIDAIYIISARD